MLEHPPIANAQEKSESLKPDFLAEVQSANADYPYWDKVKYIRTESGLSGKQLWHALKYLRQLNRTSLHFGKYRFSFMMTDEIFELLHYFDMNIGGSLTGEHLIPSENKNAYLVSSIMEEAIASSQMEGAATTRKVAKDMLRKSEKPKDKGQQMILNSYQTICQIKRNAESNFSVRQLLDIHRSMTENTLDEENDAGRIRQHGRHHR